ncbi:MAG: flagellar M-ring protein FliF [Desulfobacterales bacterium]|nr:flagellar M-ring protein FliF [Desulfobacterales bacterium]
MALSFSKIVEQSRGLWKNITPGKRIMLLSLICCAIIGLIFIITWTGAEEYDYLYRNVASEEDSGAVVNALKEQKIPYKIADKGKSIMVPKERVYELRMDLASKGIPQGSGVGFEIFDETKLGMTEFVQNINLQRAMQGELERTITEFKEVESCRVHIVMASKSLFIEQEEPATASVVLQLQRGKQLGKSQVKGIVHLVSSSISGLAPDNVTVVDTSGKMLAGFESESSFGEIGSEQMAFKEKLESRLERRIESMLEPVLGVGKTIARVSCDLDFVRQERTEEMYLPDNQVVRSEQQTTAASSGTQPAPLGVPGVISNLSAGEAGVAAGQGNSTYQKQDKTMNYEIGKVVSHKIMPVGTTARISAAVLIDGTYALEEVKPPKPPEEVAAGSGAKKKKKKKRKKKKEENKEPPKMEWVYKTRGAEEMEKIENIVKRAINFDADRGDEVELANIPFESNKKEVPKPVEESWLSTIKGWTDGMGKHALLVLFLLLLFIFVVRPLVKWLTAGPSGDVEILKQLPKTVGELETEYGVAGQPVSYHEQAKQLIAEDLDSSVEVLRQWMKEKPA